ncbi:recombinase family protein [Gordonibacter urolithinfaciens]|jgi:DNA invertase Pin-like site-specific DNA recombinase|uniref:Recombinase family protein n=1 Tax=Gordonibacter urolithinfaciens TaxID=1335613 RepID=A0A423UJ51_9ACTN|nr:recombinase family protein [Gordonibacter urolithinfaciens]MBS6974892.1 recombinase family protein [Eggerthellaceae bacterium]MCB6562342.1 recombinase family protein [Gordonibacter urolithinfaciens]MCB7086557.1 recombinase family protein [Gordonibacter urolithinfaciens]MSA95421.1 recombinase family protein [Gordonibacter urolithinfaciens]ROT89262.1 recombinase family protein [Gordonibacter urolithinfaciens]
MASTMYGYARVSSREQNLDRQLDALRAFGVEDGAVYADKASGKDFERPAWHRLMGALRPGDVLAVKSIDRLGRDYAEILDVWRDVTKVRGVFVVVLDMPVLDTREERDGITGVLIADIVLQLLSYVAQIERENIRQRQAEGIAAAKARGVSFGRPRKKRPANYGETREAYWGGRITRKEAAARCKVSETTFARWAREDGKYQGESS